MMTSIETIRCSKFLSSPLMKFPDDWNKNTLFGLIFSITL